jgi:hypothetical protein
MAAFRGKKLKIKNLKKKKKQYPRKHMTLIKKNVFVCSAWYT